MESESVTLTAIGDISFGDFPFCVGYGVRSSIDKKGPEHLFSEIKHVFTDAEIVFGNLETILSNHGHTSNDLKSMEMRGHPVVAKELAKRNFNILNMANNHIMQHGDIAFDETVNLLKQNKIEQLGLIGESDWSSNPVFIEKNGIKFGFLGYAFETDKYYKGPLKYTFGNPDSIKRDVVKIRSMVDFLIISYHWGVEFMDRPSVSNIRLAHQTIDWGADVILGHHPHVLQGIENYKNGIIFYSLGNFIFDMNWDKRFQQSMAVKLVFNKYNSIAYEIIPIKINNNYQPTIAKDKEASEINELINNISQKIGNQLEGDTEYNSYKYYLEFETIRKKNRLNSYKYFLKNIFNYKIIVLIQIILRTITRKTTYLRNSISR